MPAAHTSNVLGRLSNPELDAMVRHYMERVRAGKGRTQWERVMAEVERRQALVQVAA